MGLYRSLTIQDKLEPSDKQLERSWSTRFFGRKDKVSNLQLKYNQRSPASFMVSDGNLQHCPQMGTTLVRPDTPTKTTALNDPQEHCILFKLPYELRLAIYELFFQKSRVLVAENRACSGIFRKNSRFLPTQKTEMLRSEALRFAHFYQDDEDSITWCSETSGSQNRSYKRDRWGDIIVNPFSTNLMSTCRRICDEMAHVLHDRKTFVLALPSLLVNLKDDYLSSRSLGQIQNLHINSSWSERDDSWSWKTIEKMSLRSLTVFIDVPMNLTRQSDRLDTMLPIIVPMKRVRSIPDVHIKFERCDTPLSRLLNQFDTETTKRLWGGAVYCHEREIQYGRLV